jgi:hypothetical protein
MAKGVFICLYKFGKSEKMNIQYYLTFCMEKQMLAVQRR